MEKKLTFKYDRTTEILHMDVVPPYPDQESKELRDKDLETTGWRVLRFNTTHIREELEQYCLPTVVDNINRLGGAEEGQLAGRRFDLDAPGGYQQLLLDDL